MKKKKSSILNLFSSKEKKDNSEKKKLEVDEEGNVTRAREEFIYSSDISYAVLDG